MSFAHSVVSASHGRSGRRHLLLLLALVSSLLAQPLLAHRGALTTDASNLAFSLIYVGVMFIVFARDRERWIAYGLLLPVVVANFALYAAPAAARGAASVAFHCSIVVFLAYTVATILRELMSRRVVAGDDVLGAVCGYLLSGLAWAHVFALAYLLHPEAFGVSPDVAVQLEDTHLRNALFNYFSFTNLTSIGYADITPVAAPAYSLVWMEVMFGQFYMAVVVAQLVGLKLAQAARPEAGS